MNLCFRTGALRVSVICALAFGLLLPTVALAAGEPPSTGTLVGAVTCGADEITPAANAIVFVAGLDILTRADSSGRFTLTDVPTGRAVRVDAASDPQHSWMSSRYNVVAEPGQMLDIGSVDLAVCPVPSTPTAVTTDQDTEQRANPNE
jgi:hypothetical protein